MKPFAYSFAFIFFILFQASFGFKLCKKNRLLTSTESNRAAYYETDGHYWTVLVVATMLKIPNAKVIAYHAEYPDNIINEDGYCVRERWTFMYPKAQKKIHALTGGNPAKERAISMQMLKEATTDATLGIAAHRLGDSFSHTNDNTGRMYPHIIGHLLRWKKPDKIRNNADKYLQYVLTLVEGMGGPGASVDMTVFNYIGRNGLSSEDNSAILKAEYNLLNSSLAFNIAQHQIPVVEKYLTERLFNDGRSYITYLEADNKGKDKATIILTSAEYAVHHKLIAEK